MHHAAVAAGLVPPEGTLLFEYDHVEPGITGEGERRRDTDDAPTDDCHVVPGHGAIIAGSIPDVAAVGAPAGIEPCLRLRAPPRLGRRSPVGDGGPGSDSTE